ncbi:hypothetical protein [Pelagibius sp. 7325]|uniref:hypothetical protein n=1 Tax=Pelagibius sp. 7325 TaxID=3131994 RepID=UPI0030EDCED1
MTSGARPRILVLSRDQGSVQTTLPVVRTLAAGGDIDLDVVSLAVSRGLLEHQGIASRALDEDAFMHNPPGCMEDLLRSVRPDLVLSGSSPAKGEAPETPEQYLTMAARAAGVPTVAILDYWGMYRERFVSATSAPALDQALIPDRLCVLDTLSRDDLLSLGVPTEHMAVTHNPWMDAVVAEAACPPPPAEEVRSDGPVLLFASQPLAENAALRGWTYSQDTILQAVLNGLPPTAGWRVVIWPHPAEDKARWDRDRLPQPKGVEVVVGRERGAAVLAHVDLLVTSHSTIAYEAAYYSVPCASVRIGGPRLEDHVVDRVGLSRLFMDGDELHRYLAAFDPRREREYMGDCQRALRARGIFFSDGLATQRIVALLHDMVASAGRVSRTAR